MNRKIKVAAPAKINLSLEITDKFENSFHKLSSVMQTVSLFDYLTIELTKTDGENEIILSGNSDKIPYNEKNIVHRVISSYLGEIAENGYKISVYIEKNIPAEAGLAGGSTDGAAALLGINELTGNKLSKENLHKIASKAGSDLNFCLEGGACLLSSRGEIIEEKFPYQKYNLVIIKPKNIAVSTPECYKKFSEKYFEKKDAFYSEKIKEVFAKDFSVKNLSQYLYNDLEKPAADMFPEINEIKQTLLAAGCEGVLMSGSGSSVFGIYEEKTAPIQNENWEVFFVESVPNGVKILN